MIIKISKSSIDITFSISSAKILAEELHDMSLNIDEDSFKTYPTVISLKDILRCACKSIERCDVEEEFGQYENSDQN